MYFSDKGLKSRLLAASGFAVAVAACICLGIADGSAKGGGGTAKPPGGGGGGGATPPPPPAAGNPPVPAPPVVAAPVFTAPLGTIHAFTAIGFIQNATVSGANCPNLAKSQWGGTATVNGLTITIPCNTTLQFPAATFTWADMFDPTKVTSTQTPLATLPLPASGATFGNGTFAFPSVEMRIEGNQVGSNYIAGLIYISQQSVNTADGFITGLDYANGVIFVAKTSAGPAEVRLQINDSAGRFTKGQSPDTRFNVDDQNPTIYAGTGYPMCIPRTDPAVTPDPKCPQRNRPKPDANGNGCRNFVAAGVIFPKGGELAPPAPGQVFCSGFVMPDPATALATDPISTEQAPFEVGDRIRYSGTVLRGDGQGPNGSDTISVHTIVANVGIFTQPNTLPAYLAIGEFGAGAGADIPLTFNGVPQEVTDRLILEARVTDVKSIVDVYMVDLDPVTGAETQRWLTPNSMTSGVGAVGSNGSIIDGGITTQFDGAQVGRARIRATKAVPGIMTSPTRYMRVAVRSLCDPANINASVPQIGSNGKPIAGTSVPCLKRAQFANGLFTGQYLAPNFGFIFPENVIMGDPIVANDLWDLGFLVNGEGHGTGPLTPTPW